MTREEIMELGMEELETRKAAIAIEIDEADADQIEALNAELDAIEERTKILNDEIEERKKAAEAVAGGEGKLVKEIKEERKEEEMFGRETKEYRDAFMANLIDKATPEQRAILADNSAYGDGLALPIGIDEAIWDQVNTAHPILADVARVNSGIAIKVTKMTPSAISKKKDSDTNSEQTFTGVDVTLVGADYHAFVTLSYAEAKMSQGAMEQFLIGEVSDAIGEALAKDVFARILTDAGAGQKVTATTDSYADLKAALALATQGNPIVYAPASAYYDLVGAIHQGSPFNAGAALGVEIKKDNAATKVTVVDPKLFCLNVVQDTIVESARDPKEAGFVISGYMRAEGCLRKVKAAAYID